MRSPLFLLSLTLLAACSPDPLGTDPTATDTAAADTGDTEGDTGTTDTGATSTDDWQPSYQAGTIVDIDSGRISGVSEDDLRVFRGIPYVAPPVAANRLRDPQPVEPWTGTLDASEFGPVCPQSTVSVIDWLSQVDETDEDCLTLNVWAHDAGETGKPVMVWFHGGAFFYGAGSQDLYEGTAMAQEDVIVVTVNYRLGALGYLAHPELGSTVGNEGAGNFGLKDQIAALEWVQRNIEVFGGDPDNVTVMGESAGAISTCILASMPQSQGLMHKAIQQSNVGCHLLPTATERGLVGGSAAYELGNTYVDALGCGDASDTLACLQAVPTTDFVDLISTTSLLSEATDASFPAPWVDGSTVTEQPGVVYDRGDVDIPMIVGTNRDESTMFLGAAAPLTWLSVPSSIDTLLGTDALTDGVLDTYTIWDFPLPQDAFLTLATDVMFSCPTRAIAASSAGGEPVYLYEFQERSLTTLALGSHHALELPYVWGTFPSMGILLPSATDVALGHDMRHAWASFAHTGTPAIQGGWPAYTVGGQWMRFDDSSGLEADADWRGGRCDELAPLGLVDLTALP